jgi:TPR repeat protein
MKKLIQILIVYGLVVVIGGTASGGTVKDAEEAFSNKDYKKALAILKPLSEKGDGMATKALGLMYMNGAGVPMNFKKGFKMLKVAYKIFREEGKEKEAELTLNWITDIAEQENKVLPERIKDAEKAFSNKDYKKTIELLNLANIELPKDVEDVLILKEILQNLQMSGYKDEDEIRSLVGKILGYMFAKGLGVPKNNRIAIPLLEFAVMKSPIGIENGLSDFLFDLEQEEKKAQKLEKNKKKTELKSAGTIECEKQAWELAEMSAKLNGKDVKNLSNKDMESIKKKIENACSSYEGGASEKEVIKWIMEGGMK